MTTRRLVLTAVMIVIVASAIAVFAAGQGGLVRNLVVGLGTIDPMLLGIGLACSILSIVNRGVLNRCAHRAVGLETGVGEMTSTAAAGFAAQKMIKSAGAAGLAVFVRRGRRRGHDAASIVAACLLTAIASFASLGILLAATIVVLAVSGGLSGWWIAAAIAFAVYALVVGTALSFVLRSDRAATWVWRRVQSIRFRRRPGHAADQPMPDVMLEALRTARRRPALMARLLAQAVLSKVLGAVMLAVAVFAVGLPLDVTTALVVYSSALAASMVSIVPGGVGTVEGSMTALLVAAGGAAGASALAVAVFRLFDLLVPVVVGALAARRELGVAAETVRARDRVVSIVDPAPWAIAPAV